MRSIRRAIARGRLPPRTIAVAVTAGSGCSWASASNATWVIVAAGASGTGTGSVTLTIAANTGPQREATVTIAGQTFTAWQAAAPAPCTYSIAPSGQTFSSDANIGAVAVTTQAGCAWTASSNHPDWLSITSGETGAGSGTVTYAVPANTKHMDRKGRLTIADQTLDVTQSGNR